MRNYCDLPMPCSALHRIPFMALVAACAAHETQIPGTLRVETLTCLSQCQDKADFAAAKSCAVDAFEYLSKTLKAHRRQMRRRLSKDVIQQVKAASKGRLQALKAEARAFMTVTPDDANFFGSARKDRSTLLQATKMNTRKKAIAADTAAIHAAKDAVISSSNSGKMFNVNSRKDSSLLNAVPYVAWVLASEESLELSCKVAQVTLNFVKASTEDFIRCESLFSQCSSVESCPFIDHFVEEWAQMSFLINFINKSFLAERV